VSTHLVDVGDHAAVERFAAEVEEVHGGVDVIVNNAGVACMAAIEDATLEDFAWVLGVNLWGTIHGVKAFLPLLRQRLSGPIVNIASINAYLPLPSNGPYNVSKFGVDALSQTLMAELRGSTIRVSCVYLGVAKANIARHSRYATESDAADFRRPSPPGSGNGSAGDLAWHPEG
jgi:NAD(P)-dependent dehydrogenase (short-subunit alcohol dehydrogenase family)